MNATIETLLAQGRDILAEKDRQTKANIAAEKDRLSKQFYAAREFAITLLGQVGPVEPCEMPDDWSPGRPTTFFVCPFGAGSICVKVDLRLLNSGTRSAKEVWGTPKPVFSVAHDFQAYEDADGAWGRASYTTDSLAEALAFCERETANYLECVQQAKSHRGQREQYAAEAKHKRANPTPAEQLLTALERWHDSLPHFTEE